MTAFVPATPARLSHTSSFTASSSTISLKSRRIPCVSNKSSRALVRMNLDEDDDSPQNGAVNYDETKLFVGNLAWATTEDSLKEAFSVYGQVVDARVITDRFTGRSRGFGFVEYDAASEASNALEAMNGAAIDGRNVRVDRAATRQRQFRRGDDDHY